MTHMQNPPARDWPRAARGLPAGAGLKWVDSIQALAEARAHNPGLFLWLRHWADPLQVFIDSRDWRDHVDQARDFFARFVDGTFDQYCSLINAIEGWNEFNASSHTEHEEAIRVAGVKARAWVWENDYRSQARYAHLRLIIGNVAVGNNVPFGYAPIAVEHDCIIGYHSYIPMALPGRGAEAAIEELATISAGPSMRAATIYAPDAGYRAPRATAPETLSHILAGEWPYYSGRWASLDEAFVAAGYRVDWIFTESGEVGYGTNANGDVYLRAFDGWRHPTVCGGNFELVIDGVRYWLDRASQTRAWKEGRIIGGYGALFTSSANLGDWPDFQKGAPELERFAQVVSEYEPVPPPEPEPEPEPRSYARRIFLIPQDATPGERAEAEEAAHKTRSTLGYSVDDACIDHPNLTRIEIVCYAPERIGGSANALVAWQELYYPTSKVAWEFREFGFPFERLRLGPVLPQAHVVTDDFDAPRDYRGNHEGIDLDILGTARVDVLAAAAGRCVVPDPDLRGYGTVVVLEHTIEGHRYLTWYAHLSAAYVVPGTEVAAGEPIGRLGTSGLSSGDHLHFNLQVPGYGRAGYVVPDVVDPRPYLEGVS